MNFRFVVEVQVARVHGKFAGKDEIETQIQDALDGADPGTYEGDNGGEYETADWSVSAEAVPKTSRSIAPNLLAESLMKELEGLRAFKRRVEEKLFTPEK